MVAKWLRNTGVVLGGISLVVILSRIWGSRSYLPAGLPNVVLFAFTDLFLLPSAVILLVLGVVLSWARRPRRGAQTDDPDRRTRRLAVGITAGIIILVMACVAAVSGRYVRPVLAERLEWGRYGAGPPVELTSLAVVTEKTDLEFPDAALLIDGEYIGQLFPYVIAKIRMPHDDVDEFLAQHPFLGETNRDLKAFHDVPMMKERGWDVESIEEFVSVSGRQRHGYEILAVVVDLDDPSGAVVYLYWELL
jgi:hypothetical protein